MQKGQASAELLIILAISLIALTAIFSFSNSSLSELNRQKLVQTAQSSVDSAKEAANDVYRQGVGATKQVFFVVPSGVEAQGSGISGNTFVLRLLGSDVYAKTDVNLSGSVPTNQGGHWVTLTAFENFVAVGTQSLSADRTSVYVTMLQGGSAQDTITFTNSGSSDAVVAITKNWQNPDVGLTLSTQSFTLSTGQQQLVTLDFSSSASASGNYIGSLEIGASFAGGADENFSVPVNVEVLAPSGGTETALIILPLTYSATIQEGSSASSSFNACNNSTSQLDNVAFTGSGAVASWVLPIPNIASLNVGSCQGVPFTINVPAAQPAGS